MVYVHVLPLKGCRFHAWQGRVENQLFGDAVAVAVAGFGALPEKTAVPAYAPFSTRVVNVDVRDSTYVLDALLYHESDLRIESTTPTRRASPITSSPRCACGAFALPQASVT
jgi:Transposase.